jgi:hypothetical protein
MRYIRERNSMDARVILASLEPNAPLRDLLCDLIISGAENENSHGSYIA